MSDEVISTTVDVVGSYDVVTILKDVLQSVGNGGSTRSDSLVSWLRLFAMPMRFLAMTTVSALCPLTTSPFKADSRMYSANLRLAFLALSFRAS